MGTLFNQKPRKDFYWSKEDLFHRISEMQEVAEAMAVSMDQVIKVAQILEMERGHDLYRANGDAWDEQIAGIGELLKPISEAFQTISEQLINEGISISLNSDTK